MIARVLLAGSAALSAALSGCAVNEPPPELDCSEGRCDVFGTDDRKDPFDPEVPEAHRRALRSTGSLVFAGNVGAEGDAVRLRGATVRELFEQAGRPLCPGERFADEPHRSFCSGSLIASDTFLTAAHCVQLGIPLDELCGKLRVVFGFAHERAGDDPTLVEASDAYGCRAIELPDTRDDWALVRLDRDVLDRDPLPLASNEVAIDQSLLMIGNPLGMPSKLAMGRVVEPELGDVFLSDHDAFQGNSGSALLDPVTFEVHGVLSGGSQDFAPTEDGCFTAQLCDEVLPGNFGVCSGTRSTPASRIRF